MRGIFVTGTDTNIGKTVISAALMCALRCRHDVCYWKPVQTGIESDDDTRTVRELGDCADEEIFNRGYRLEKPLSPHLSARLADVRITLGQTIKFIEHHRVNKFWIIEGAGGTLVPLNDEVMMINLMMVLDLPVIVVAQSGLGTINHTLLTLEALTHRGLKVLGVVMNGEPNKENRKAIEHFGKVKVLAEVPKFDEPMGENLRFWARHNRSSFDAVGNEPIYEFISTRP